MSKPVPIIVIEDGEGHARLIERNIRRSGVNTDIIPFTNGTDAVNYLFGKDGTGDQQNGAALLILLDLNLPKKDGREVLAEIKADDNLKQIPVVILTTSQDEQDVLKSYNLYANCYITKPVDLEQFITVVKSIEDFWLGIVVLPKNVKGNVV